MPIVSSGVCGKIRGVVGEQRKKLAAAADDPSKKWNLADLRARGEKVYAANCVACHQASGQGVKERSRARRLGDRQRQRAATSRSC